MGYVTPAGYKQEFSNVRYLKRTWMTHENENDLRESSSDAAPLQEEDGKGEEG